MTEAGEDVVVRMSALCSRHVIDAAGRPQGTVLDVRLVRDGPTNASGDAAVRIDGLVIGRDGWAERTGLFRHAVHGPWLLKRITQPLRSDRTYLPWKQLVDPRELAAEGPVRFHGDLQGLPDLPN